MVGTWKNISRDGHDAFTLVASDGCVMATVGERNDIWFCQAWTADGRTIKLAVASTPAEGMRAVEAAYE
jgi:hypothetical protein